jgi:thioredoxin reductase (NADPH)
VTTDHVDAAPVFLLVDDDAATLDDLAATLRRRFGADYRILAEQSAAHGLDVLKALHDNGEPVALLLSDLWMPEMTGVEFLVRAHELHPSARRALIFVGWDLQATEQTGQAMALGWIDTWMYKPWEPAEQHLYPRVGEVLCEWAVATAQPGFRAMRIVAEPRSARTHELRDMLDRNDVPVEFFLPDSPQGRQLLAITGQDDARLPLVVYHDGRVSVDPSITEVVEGLGVPIRPDAEHYDLIVVGAGPAGLSAAMCAASEGLSTLMVEPFSFGGQASSTSKIRNYLGFPRGISGRQLATLAYEQSRLFGASYVFDHAIRLDVQGDELALTLGAGGKVSGDVVVISVGVEYRRLAVTGLDDLLGAGIFYGAAVSEAFALRDRHAVVIGGGNSAGQAAVHLAKYAAQVTLLVRGSALSSTMSDYLINEIKASPGIRVRLNTQVTCAAGAGRLEWLTLYDAAEGRSETVAAAALFIMIGARPHTDWLADVLLCDDFGFILTGADLTSDARLAEVWRLEREPMPMETSVPGVFAVGDVRHGSVKRVASAVGAGSIAIQFAHRFLAAR